MLFTPFIIMLLNLFRPCEGSPTFHAAYCRNSSYVPQTIDTGFGLYIVAPDSPYVAAAGMNHLYFIDTRFDAETAAHIKKQIEASQVPGLDEYTQIDEFSATAKNVKAKTGETTFVFDPAYARVLFARGINKRNPELRPPEHEPAGEWLVTYDLGHTLTKRIGSCED